MVNVWPRNASQLEYYHGFICTWRRKRISKYLRWSYSLSSSWVKQRTFQFLSEIILSHFFSVISYVQSLRISLVLASLNICGYIIIVLFLGLTQVPIIIRRLDEFVEDFKVSTSRTLIQKRNKSAFNPWTVTLVRPMFHKVAGSI